MKIRKMNLIDILCSHLATEIFQYTSYMCTSYTWKKKRQERYQSGRFCYVLSLGQFYDKTFIDRELNTTTTDVMTTDVLWYFKYNV